MALRAGRISLVPGLGCTLPLASSWSRWREGERQRKNPVERNEGDSSCPVATAVNGQQNKNSFQTFGGEKFMSPFWPITRSRRGVGLASPRWCRHCRELTFRRWTLPMWFEDKNYDQVKLYFIQFHCRKKPCTNKTFWCTWFVSKHRSCRDIWYHKWNYSTLVLDNSESA